MKKLFNILIIMTLAVAANAQTDTLQKPNLFRNATSDTEENSDVSTHVTNSQRVDSVAESIRNLLSLYSSGKYLDVLDLSKEIHKKYHLSQTQNQLRQKYTIAAYKDLAYHHEADSAAKVFLQKDPFYKVMRFDPVPFRDVLNNYYTMPKFSIWMSLGYSTLKPHLDTVHVIIDTLQRKPTYEAVGFSAQLGFEYHFMRFLSVSAAPTFTTYEMNRSSKRSEISTFYYNEKFQTIALPIFVEAYWYMGRYFFVPSVYAGVQAKYLIQSKLSTYEETDGVYLDIPSYEENTDIKNRFNVAMLGGIRLNFNHRRMTYFGDLGIAYDLNELNNASKKLETKPLIYNQTFIPDSYHIIEYLIRLGVKINLKYTTIAKFDYGH